MFAGESTPPAGGPGRPGPSPGAADARDRGPKNARNARGQGGGRFGGVFFLGAEAVGRFF